MTRNKRNAEASAEGAQALPDGVRTNIERRRTSRNGAVMFAAVVFVVFFALVLVLAWALFGQIGIPALVAAVVVGWLASLSIHMVLEWEKAVVLRFGKFNRVVGPGIVFTWPILEFYTIRIDQRVATTYFSAEETLTSDLVPINVDAVLFWMVWSPQKAAMEVEDYASAVSLVAQTALRKSIGRATASEVATRREELDEELREAIEDKLAAWGITIIDVEIRDIVIPKELQEAMAQEAVAERKRAARMTLAEAERDIAEMLKDASGVYAGDADAMRLRTMHLSFESVETSGGTLMVPSSFADGFVGEGGAGAVGGAEAPAAQGSCE